MVLEAPAENKLEISRDEAKILSCCLESAVMDAMEWQIAGLCKDCHLDPSQCDLEPILEKLYKFIEAGNS